MKKIFVILLIILCTGCFFEKKEVLECSSNYKVGEVKITNNYKFIYKKEELKEILLKIRFDCKKDNGKKVYERYIKIYKELNKSNNNLKVNYYSDECIIEVSSKLEHDKEKVLNSLNLTFLEDTSIDMLRETLNNTAYQCK